MLVAALALVLVFGLLAVGGLVWKRLNRTSLEEALSLVPASSARVAFTDWGVVRAQLGAKLGDDPDGEAVLGFMERAYDTDYSAVSSIDDAAVGLQEKFGFSPATAQWEVFAQGEKGATMVLKVAEGADFDVLAGNLASAGFEKPKQDDGVWQGGVDLVSGLDPTFTPELQFIALIESRGLVVTSDNPDFAETAAGVARGDAGSFAGVDGVSEMASHVGETANAMVWGRDFACTDLSMARADEDAQARADGLVEDVGGVTPLDGLTMAMQPDRSLLLDLHFEDSDRAQRDLRPRAKLAVGEAVGRGGSFSESLELTSSKAVGSDVLLRLRPREKEGFVLSAVYDGPVVFATC